MKEINNLITFESETGEKVELLLLKKFECNKNEYAILMDSNDCDCGNDCKCDDNCDCEDDCKCDDNCDCKDDCSPNGLYLFKITKDKDGKEVYVSIEDETELDKVIKEADKALNEE